jgi:hypothetical protein
MESILTVTHENTDSIVRGVDTFSKFYASQFHDQALARHIKTIRIRYYFAVGALAFLAIIGTIPILVLPSSIFSKILLGLGMACVGGIGFCVFKINRAPEEGEKTLERYLDLQFSHAKSKELAVSEIRLYDDHIETVSGAPESKTVRVKKRSYQDIKQLYETDSLYYFEGMHWIPKDGIAEEDRKVLAAIAEDHFPGDRYHLIESC